MKEKQLNLFGIESDKRYGKKRPTLILPLDTLILLGIVVFLLLILSFSLGVEKGRKTAYRNLEKEKQLLKESQFQTADVKNSPKQTAVETKDSEVQKTEKEPKQTIIEKEESWDDNKYLIQVATYLTEKTAKQEAEKLQNKGYPVVITKKGKFVVIFVGGFKDKEKAKENMKSLKEKYKDCFIRRL